MNDAFSSQTGFKKESTGEPQQANLDDNGLLKVNVTAGGGSAPSGTIGAAVPATASPAAVKDASGNLAYPLLDATGALCVAGTTTRGAAYPAAGIPVFSAMDASFSAVPLNIDGSGNLLVAVTGAGSGGTSSTDRAAYTAGTTAGTPMMVARDDAAPGTLAEDKVGIVRGSSLREVYTQIRDAAGNDRGANVSAAGALSVDAGLSYLGGNAKTVDTNVANAKKDTNTAFDDATFIGNIGFGALVVRHDAPSATTGVNDTFGYPSVDAVGRLWVNGSNVTQPVSDAGGTLSVDDGGGSLTVDGSVTVTQATGSNLHAVLDSGTLTGITNVVHVDDNAGSLTVDGSVTAVQGAAAAVTAPWPVNYGVPAQTSGNLVNTGDTVSTALSGMSTVMVLLTIASNIGGAGGAVLFEASLDGSNWNGVYGYIHRGDIQTGNGPSVSNNVTLTTTALTNPTTAIIPLPAGATNFRLRRSNDGNGGTIVGRIAPGAAPSTPVLAATPVDITRVNGSTAQTGNGTSASALRVSVANDSTGTIVPWDGTNKATVKAASTASVAADTSLVVQLNPTALVESVPSGGFGNTALRVFVNSIRKATYYASARNITTGALVANTNKAILSLDHAVTSTKFARIRRIIVGGIVTTAGGAAVSDIAFAITRGTAQNTGGTTVTPGLANSAEGAADTTVKSLPTIVSATAVYTTGVVWAPAAGLTVGTQLPRTVIYDWSEAGAVEPLTLSAAVLQNLVVNIVSTNTPTLSLSIDVEFTEE